MDKCQKIEFDDWSLTYSCFLNDFNCELNLDGKSWKSVSHYYYAKMFEDKNNELMEQIRNSDILNVKKIVDENYKNARSNWYVERLNVLYSAIKAKFENNNYKNLLMQTKDKFLLYINKDNFFGNGLDNTGRNILGKILMEVRMELK